MATYRSTCRSCGGPLHVRCTDCEDRGWGHYEGNKGPEIQRCDCARFPTDEDAQAAHQVDCGCGWGTDWYHQLYEVTVKLTVAAPPDQAADIEEVVARLVEADLPGLVTNLPAGGLMNVCSAETVTISDGTKYPSRKLLVELGVLDDD